MTDHLSALPVQEVAAWYQRLADEAAKEKIKGQEPLSAVFLKTWLKNRNPNFTLFFHAPQYLKNSFYVIEVLKYHRSVFLSEQKARYTGGLMAWAGLLPRMQGLPGFKTWDLNMPLNLEYESLVEVGNSFIDVLRIQNNGTYEEKDLLGSLRGFQLKSFVTVNGRLMTNKNINIQFKNWECEITDTYDFDYNKHFTPGNPDFGKHHLKWAVRPQDKRLTVYHRNAKRLEDAKLACPYKIKSYRWRVSGYGIADPAEIDPSRNLS